MATQGMIQVPGSANEHIGSFLRQFFAAVSICGFVGFGLYRMWQNGWKSDVLVDLLIFGVTAGPATAYVFGYFYCLPDVLGGSAAQRRGTLLQRWSDYARLSIAFAIVLTWTGWCIVIPQLTRREAVESILGLLTVTFIMPAAVVATEQYLARTMEPGEVSISTGWRAAARRLVCKSGALFLKLLGMNRALLAGSALVFLSLVLSKFPKGYQMLIGEERWITTELSQIGGTRTIIVAQGGRWAYALGIAVALLSLMSVLLGRYGNALRKSRWLLALAGALGLYVLCDFTFGWLWLSPPRPVYFVFAVWLAAWGIPILLWLWRARGDRQEWNYTRLAAMIFYLPIFFVCLAFLVTLTFLAPGPFFFVVGMLFLWWGLVRSQGEDKSLSTGQL